MVFVDTMKILGLICLLLAIVGTIGNILVFLVCFFRLRNQVTFIFVMFLAISDCVSLYEWNLTHFSDAFFTPNLLFKTSIQCKLLSFFQYCSLHTSAWLMVLMAFERFVSIWIRSWRLVYFKTKHAMITCLVCITIIVLANTNVLVLYGYDVYDENGTYVESVCWELDDVPQTKWMTTWNSVHTFLYSYIPFPLLAIANILLIVTLRFKKNANMTQSATQKARQRSATLTVVIVTIMFILFTGTGAVVNFFVSDLLESYTGVVIITLGDTLCFTFHGLNILTLLAVNKKFREEFRNVVEMRINLKTVSGQNTTASENHEQQSKKNPLAT